MEAEKDLKLGRSIVGFVVPLGMRTASEVTAFVGISPLLLSEAVTTVCEMVWTSRPFGRASADEPWVIVALGSLPEEFVITVAKIWVSNRDSFLCVKSKRNRRHQITENVLLLFLMDVAMDKPCFLAISCRILFPTK